MHSKGLILRLAALVFAGCLFTGHARAQSIFGFKVGDDLVEAVKSHPKHSDIGEQGEFVVVKWNFRDGDSVSVTASPKTHRIVYIESDWGGDARGAATDIDGMTFGRTRLADIRQRFQSNGFAFKSNVVQTVDGRLIGMNCYQVDGDRDLIAVFVTALPIKNIPIVAGAPQPDPGQGRLTAVILASLDYLKEIWGSDRLFDPANHPIALK